MGIPHAIVIPYPMQGHVSPLMELSYCLAELGVLVTFVNTETTHAQLMAAAHLQNFITDSGGRIRLVPITDGAMNDDDRKDSRKFFGIMQSALPSLLEELIVRINEEEEHKITWMIADGCIAWVLDVANKLNIRRAAFWPTSAWFLAILFEIPMLIETGVINQNGFPVNDKWVQISDKLPNMNPVNLPWVPFGEERQQEGFFRYLWKCTAGIQGLDQILCNSFPDIESPALELVRNSLPIGPLVLANGAGHRQSSFWKEDQSCIGWLGLQPARSVVYVSFGSTTMLSKDQLHELELALELNNRPFLWVCRPNLMHQSAVKYADGFIDRVADRGHIVEWAPQKEVLSHSSIACFVTHCGWNSAMEGISNGVPMLCWPYFADQFQNQTYIADLWKVGLKLMKNDNGIVTKEEINAKIEELINDEGIRERVLELREKGKKTVMNGGISYANLVGFVRTMKTTSETVE